MKLERAESTPAASASPSGGGEPWDAPGQDPAVLRALAEKLSAEAEAMEAELQEIFEKQTLKIQVGCVLTQLKGNSARVADVLKQFGPSGAKALTIPQLKVMWSKMGVKASPTDDEVIELLQEGLERDYTIKAAFLMRCFSMWQV